MTILKVILMILGIIVLLPIATCSLTGMLVTGAVTKVLVDEAKKAPGEAAKKSVVKVEKH